jgi:hypothetical protein
MRRTAAVALTALLFGCVPLAHSKNCEGFGVNTKPVKSNPGPFEFATITAAIKDSSPFTTEGNPTACVLLYPNGAQDRTINESIELGGTNGITDTANGLVIYDVRIETFQDEQNTGKVIWVPTGVTAGRTVLLHSGFPPGGGIERRAYLYVDGVIFQGGGTGNPGGGAVLADKSHIECHHCTFRRNASYCGGAMAGLGVIPGFLDVPAVPALIEAHDSVFDTNLACQGGAIDVRNGAEALIHNCLFMNNRAEAGAGLFIGAGQEFPAPPSPTPFTPRPVDPSSRAVVTGSQFTGGTSTLVGDPFSTIPTTYCQTALDQPNPGSGICSLVDIAAGDRPEFARFELAKSGGAIQVHGRFEGDRLDIHDNAMAGPGGGIYVKGEAARNTFRLTNSFVTNNDSNGGDGIQFDFQPLPTPGPSNTPFPTAPPTRTRTPTRTATETPTFVGDTPTPTDTPTGTSPTPTSTRTASPTATDTPTATLTPTGPSPTATPEILPLVLWNDTVAGNGNTSGQGITLSPAGFPDAANLIVWNNGDDLVGISGVLSNSIVQDTDDPVTGVTHDPPLFVSSSDYHIRVDTSPAKDAGDPRVLSAPTPLGSQDIDGEARVIGAQIDIGADEIGTPRVTATPTASPSPSPLSLAAQPNGGALPVGLVLLGLLLVLAARLRSREHHG